MKWLTSPLSRYLLSTLLRRMARPLWYSKPSTNSARSTMIPANTATAIPAIWELRGRCLVKEKHNWCLHLTTFVLSDCNQKRALLTCSQVCRALDSLWVQGLCIWWGDNITTNTFFISSTVSSEWAVGTDTYRAHSFLAWLTLLCSWGDRSYNDLLHLDI